MSELEEKLNKILSNPSEMEKIMTIARSLSGSLGTQPAAGGGTAAPAASAARAAQSAFTAEAAQPAQAATAEAAPLDLSSLTSVFKDIDPKIFRLVTRLAGEYTSGNNDKAVLLNAMKPYLKEDRRSKIDRAAELAKLARLARLAFSEFSGGEKRV